MKANQVRFTTYDTSQRNADLTYEICVVGIPQSPPSINEVVYMIYSYEGRSYVFGRALVSLIMPRCNWPEEHEFVAYCLSEREIESCSPIDIEELSLQSICEIYWYLEKGQPVVDDLATNRLSTIFDKQRLEAGVKHSPEKESKQLESTRISFWSKFLSWLYNEKPSQAATKHSS